VKIALVEDLPRHHAYHTVLTLKDTISAEELLALPVLGVLVLLYKRGQKLPCVLMVTSYVSREVQQYGQISLTAVRRQILHILGICQELIFSALLRQITLEHVLVPVHLLIACPRLLTWFVVRIAVLNREALKLVRAAALKPAAPMVHGVLAVVQMAKAIPTLCVQVLLV